jgi:hypothetical protein
VGECAGEVLDMLGTGTNMTLLLLSESRWAPVQPRVAPTPSDAQRTPASCGALRSESECVCAWPRTWRACAVLCGGGRWGENSMMRAGNAAAVAHW